MSRKQQPRGRPTIFEGSDGWYHCYVTIGLKPNGTPRRKHIRRKTSAMVLDAVEDLEKRIRQGNGIPTEILTVEDWLNYWLEEIIRRNRKYNTWRGHRSALDHHVIPVIGRYRLDGTRNRLEPEHLDTMHSEMQRRGVKDNYRAKVHRILRTALAEAVRRGKAGRNVADMVLKPVTRTVKIKPHTLEEAQAIIRTAVVDVWAARWYLGILSGLRQGEVLGLRWSDLELDAAPPRLQPQKQVQRRRWEHGCTDPVACAARKCRRKACPPRWEHGCVDAATCKIWAHFCPARRRVPGCNTHQRACPKVCAPGCTDHARACPDKIGGGLVEEDLKTEKSDRTVVIAAVAAEALRQHREAQIRERAAAGHAWDSTGFVFATPSGRPVDPRVDHERWEQLLKRAGLPDSRLHLARHDAGTLRLATGTDIRVVQDDLGHSSIKTTQGYVDVAVELKQQAVERVASALFDGGLAALLQQSSATVLPGK
ncbi:tyrosine recombinase XerC [Catenuloplanes sp. NPDC051500]|uniref:tyrosine recombinase XerC n=1 Tax=Catenuloplanes sp. NPDC051500 TaxID=3363959 RepID=UPI00378C8832